MKKWLVAVVALSILGGACGGGTVTEASIATVPPTTAPASTTQPATTEAPASATSEAADPTTTTEAPAPVVVVDGPPAPDFALALDDGRGFILSEEQRPVYMIFWAEW